MAQVDITVNGRQYKITCDDGQEQRLQRLAAYFDSQVSTLGEELGQIGDARLMLLSALTVCDDLFEARERAASLENAADALDAVLGGSRGGVADEVRAGTHAHALSYAHARAHMRVLRRTR
ncbi:MAG: cell division protein ZapA [Pseudomonadota bacterium]